MRNIDPVEKWTYIIVPIAIFLLIIVVHAIFRVESKVEECQKYGGIPIWIYNSELLYLVKDAVIQSSGGK